MHIPIWRKSIDIHSSHHPETKIQMDYNRRTDRQTHGRSTWNHNTPPPPPPHPSIVWQGIKRPLLKCVWVCVCVSTCACVHACVPDAWVQAHVYLVEETYRVRMGKRWYEMLSVSLGYMLSQHCGCFYLQRTFQTLDPEWNLSTFLYKIHRQLLWYGNRSHFNWLRSL